MNVGQVESTGIHPCHLLCIWREKEKGGGEVRHKINGMCGLEPGKIKLFSILCTKEENNLRGGGGGVHGHKHR